MAKTFPRLCGNCGKVKVVPIITDYNTQFKHKNKIYDIQIDKIEIPTCLLCGNQWIGAKEDEIITQAINNKIIESQID